MTHDKGGVYSVGYNAWSGHDGLTRMFDALEAEGVTILVDTRKSDYRARYSFDQLTDAARERDGMRYAHRPALSGKPQAPWEFTEDGHADYAAMDKRDEAAQTLDGIAQAAKDGERIALLCSCKGLHTCHRTRWLAASLEQRGIDVGHIEPGEWNQERTREEGVHERHRVTPHSALPDLPGHSDINWAERIAYWQDRKSPKPPPDHYQSPLPTRQIPDKPTQILIAGSMNANNAQLNYASALVVRAAEIGAQIHIGDNDQGVEARVVETANSIGYDNVVVWTAEEDPRNGGVQGGQIRKVPHNYREPGSRFTQRDRTMIGSLDREHGAAIFIDNGFTHQRNGRLTSTEAAYTVAVEQGKAAKKVSFGRTQDRAAERKPLPTTYQHPTEPLYGYSIHAVQTVNNEGNELGYSAVALRDVYATGVPNDSDISESYAMELARFAERVDSEKYVGELTNYIAEKEGLEFTGSAEGTAGTGAFLDKVAEKNGLEVQAQLVERDDLLQEGLLHTGYNLAIEPMPLPDDQPQFNPIIDR